MNSLAYVPLEFQPEELHKYPSDNIVPFEEYYHDEFHPIHDQTERIYLPIFWTAYLKNNAYGEDKNAIARLQHFIDGLDPSRKYYSICQFDYGPMVDLSRLDIRMFSMAAMKPCDFKLPLLCSPHHFQFNHEPRNIFASFVGSVTHDIRRRMMLGLNKVRPTGKDYYISTYQHPMQDYCRIMAKSIFCLAPRGVSPNSFRIQEAIQYGAIPVIITDELFVPEYIPFEDFGVIITEENIHRIDTILESIPDEEIRRKQSLLPDIFLKYYTFTANKSIIINNLNHVV